MSTARRVSGADDTSANDVAVADTSIEPKRYAYVSVVWFPSPRPEAPRNATTYIACSDSGTAAARTSFRRRAPTATPPPRSPRRSPERASAASGSAAAIAPLSASPQASATIPCASASATKTTRPAIAPTA